MISKHTRIQVWEQAARRDLLAVIAFFAVSIVIVFLLAATWAQVGRLAYAKTGLDIPLYALRLGIGLLAGIGIQRAVVKWNDYRARRRFIQNHRPEPPTAPVSRAHNRHWTNVK